MFVDLKPVVYIPLYWLSMTAIIYIYTYMEVFLNLSYIYIHIYIYILYIGLHSFQGLIATPSALRKPDPSTGRREDGRGLQPSDMVTYMQAWVKWSNLGPCR